MVGKLVAVEVYGDLKDVDFRVLRAVELRMRHYKWAPLEEIAAFSRMDDESVSFHLDRLNNWGLVRRRSDIGYIGYQLTMHGYDALAIRALARKGILEAIGRRQIGVGKEADVYEGLTPNGERVAIKFNRIGRTSFTRVKLYREGLDKHHTSWLYISRIVARREHEVLRLLSPIAKVPNAICWNRHVVVMNYVDGRELAALDLSKEHARSILDTVLEEYLKIVEFGIVHSDMSEFNVVLRRNGDIMIIDWPQYMTTANPESLNYLRRDITVLLSAFRRRWDVKMDFNRVWDAFLQAWKDSRK